MSDEFLTIAEAKELLGVSRTKIWHLVRTGALKSYASPLDARRRLFKRADLEKLKKPQLRT